MGIQDKPLAYIHEVAVFQEVVSSLALVEGGGVKSLTMYLLITQAWMPRKIVKMALVV